MAPCSRYRCVRSLRAWDAISSDPEGFVVDGEIAQLNVEVRGGGGLVLVEAALSHLAPGTGVVDRRDRAMRAQAPSVAGDLLAAQVTTTKSRSAVTSMRLPIAFG